MGRVLVWLKDFNTTSLYNWSGVAMESSLDLSKFWCWHDPWGLKRTRSRRSGLNQDYFQWTPWSCRRSFLTRPEGIPLMISSMDWSSGNPLRMCIPDFPKISVTTEESLICDEERSLWILFLSWVRIFTRPSRALVRLLRALSSLGNILEGTIRVVNPLWVEIWICRWSSLNYSTFQVLMRIILKFLYVFSFHSLFKI